VITAKRLNSVYFAQLSPLGRWPFTTTHTSAAARIETAAARIASGCEIHQLLPGTEGKVPD
jgi:hypothetical protein